MSLTRILPIEYFAVRDWVPVLVVMAWVGIVSLMPIESGTRVWNHFDKIIHAGLYGLLGFLSSRAAGKGQGRRVAVGVLAFVIAMVFGGLMEWLQSFVERGPSWGDMAADAGGAAGGAALWLLRRQRSRSGS